VRLYLLLGALVLLGAPASQGDRFTRPLGFALAADVPLAAVQRKLGPATIVYKDDAGDFDERLCYVANPQRLIVEFASGEIGGPEHEVLEFVIAAEDAEPPPNCWRLTPKVARSLKFDVGGLHIGMTRSQFNKTVAPTAALGDELARMFEYTVPMPAVDVREKSVALGRALTPEERHYDATILVRGTFRAERLVRLQVDKTLTW
jgi:hypothetical protein